MKKKKIFALMAAALSLTACSTNDVADITHDDADNVVNVASVTRSGEGASTTSPMTAPFHLINITQATKRNVNFEADFTYDNNTNQYAQTGDSKVVWYNVKDADGNEIPNEFKAFSPLRTVANEASYTTFQILPDQSTADKLAAADWMTATATSTKAAATDGLSLNFVHKNAKLHFDVTLKGDAAAMTSNNIKVLGAITPYYNSTDNSKTIEAIVKPKDYSESGTNLIELSINIDENTSETLAVPFPSGLSTLSPGKQYNFNLVIGHNAATISSVYVTDWDNSSIDLGGHDDALTIPYVTFTSNEEVGFKMTTKNYTISGLEYSVNNGKWTSIHESGISEGIVTFGGNNGNLRLRGKNLNGTATYDENYATISFTSDDTSAKVACTGDIRTLLDYENYKTVDTNNARFCYLFKDCTRLTSAPDLPPTTLADYCYYGMFNGCKSLTKAPQLPATTLANYNYCYSFMFGGCTSLTTAPELPATTLANNCYFYMFSGCSSLTTAPELPATTLANSCYNCMFRGCSSLTTAPELPAETLADNCYSNMFLLCTALITAPELPATTLANSCYDNMFNGCTSLTEAPELKATTLVNRCYLCMFDGCTSLTIAPELKATTLATYCYYYMFYGCKKLQSVTMLATNVSASNCLDSWLGGSAGKDNSVTSRTLTVANQAAYNNIESSLPNNWKEGASGTTVNYIGQ